MCLVAQSCPTVCNPVDRSPPGSSAIGFPRQEYWSGFPFPPPEHFPNSGIQPMSPVSLILAGRFLTTEPPVKPACVYVCVYIHTLNKLNKYLDRFGLNWC